VAERCELERWTGKRPIPGGGWLDVALQPHTVTMHDLNAHVVLPATAERKCSFVELVASAEQPPEWFVSHAWAGTLDDMLACLAEHARLRGLSEESAPYWVCIFANNQHGFSADGEANAAPEHTPFARALTLARGLLAVIDEGATQLERVWCVYEMFLASTLEPRKLFDAATVVRAGGQVRAAVITQGVAELETRSNGKISAHLKAERESLFTAAVMDRALVFDSRDGQASVPADKARIGAAIADREELVNATVAVQLNAPRISSVLYGGDTTSRALLLAKLASSGVRALSLVVDSQAADAAVDELLGRHLPPTLVELRAVGVGPRVLEGVLAQLRALTHMSLRGARDADRVERLRAALAQLPALVQLSLGDDDLRDAGCDALADALGQLDALQTLTLGSNQIGDAGCEALAGALGRLPALQELRLGSNQIGDAGCASLARAFAQMPALREIRLNSNQIGDAGCVSLAGALGQLGALQLLSLSGNRFGDAGRASLAEARAQLSAEQQQALDVLS
jgi:hypothetical protein